MKRAILACTALLLLLSACDKRYPEGPCLSFIKADNRIAGKWAITELAVNDSTEHVRAFADYTLSFFFNIEHLAFVNLVSNANDSIVAQGNVIINDRRTIMEFEMLRTAGNEAAADSILLRIPPFESKNEWAITRLKRKEMHIASLVGGKEYKISLELISDFDNN
jgi:hypothetical protein